MLCAEHMISIKIKKSGQGHLPCCFCSLVLWILGSSNFSGSGGYHRYLGTRNNITEPCMVCYLNMRELQSVYLENKISQVVWGIAGNQWMLPYPPELSTVLSSFRHFLGTQWVWGINLHNQYPLFEFFLVCVLEYYTSVLKDHNRYTVCVCADFHARKLNLVNTKCSWFIFKNVISKSVILKCVVRPNLNLHYLLIF